MNYIQIIQDLLDKDLKMKDTPYEGLLETYAVLVLVVGEKCTKENIHDAWSVWQNKTRPNHNSLIPFLLLTKEVQDLDEKYKQAVINVAQILRTEDARGGDCSKCGAWKGGDYGVNGSGEQGYHDCKR
ncbi:MAG: hypothetical protein KAS32_12485 [Candidatus Peribacteraceae bacterium]|nr:hypothetical protein [Candidatus Peribacteraceae bacterium]